MNDNEKEAVTKFLDFAKFAVVALLVAAGILGPSVLGL
jgi:hypothetical protein